MVLEMAWHWKSEMTTRSIVDLTKGEKLDDNNYAMWYTRIQYLLNEQEVSETLTSAMIQIQLNTTMIWKPIIPRLKKIDMHVSLC